MANRPLQRVLVTLSPEDCAYFMAYSERPLDTLNHPILYAMDLHRAILEQIWKEVSDNDLWIKIHGLPWVHEGRWSLLYSTRSVPPAAYEHLTKPLTTPIPETLPKNAALWSPHWPTQNNTPRSQSILGHLLGDPCLLHLDDLDKGPIIHSVSFFDACSLLSDPGVGLI